MYRLASYGKSRIQRRGARVCRPVRMGCMQSKYPARRSQLREGMTQLLVSF